MNSGESSSLAISSESMQTDQRMGAPGIAQISDSRSSSVRSVATPRNVQLKDKRPRSALARGGSVEGSRNRGSPSSREHVPTGSQEPGTRHQTLNQVYVAPSLNPGVVSQAAEAVMQSRDLQTLLQLRLNV